MSECRDLHVGTAVRPFASPTSSVQWTERHCRWVPVCAAAAEVLLGGRSWAGKGSQREVRRPVTRNPINSQLSSGLATPSPRLPRPSPALSHHHHCRAPPSHPKARSHGWFFTGPEEHHLRETSNSLKARDGPGTDECVLRPQQNQELSFPAHPPLLETDAETPPSRKQAPNPPCPRGQSQHRSPCSALLKEHHDNIFLKISFILGLCMIFSYH